MATFAELQQTFKRVNVHVLRLWRWHLGWMMSALPPVTGKTMIVTHTGRKSGVRRQTPASYSVIGGDVWCTTNVRAQWLGNIRANPAVEVWLPLRRPRQAVAEELPIDADHVEHYRAVLIASGFAASRFTNVRPRRATADELVAHGSDSVLLRLRRGAPLPRRRGPGTQGGAA